MDPRRVDPRTPSLYQRELFMRNARNEPMPAVSAVPEEAKEQARVKLAEGGFWYATSNAGLGDTHRANREAFSQWKISPKMLVDTRQRDLSCELFGHKLAAPIMFAPVGLNKIYHEDGEKIPASVAQELGLGYMLSTAGSTSIEDVAKANGDTPTSFRFFQLYMGDDDDITVSLLERAVKAGFTAMVVTVDTPQLGWRPTDADRGNYAIYSKGIGNEMGRSDPVFMGKSGHEIERDSSVWFDRHVWHGRQHTWAKMEWLCSTWKRVSGGKPWGIKGIQRADDALRCIEVGCDFVSVSNHAGRQVDGSHGALEVLPEIVDAVNGKVPVIFDSGIRGAADVFKALALGAKAVMVGRLYVYGMSAGGRAGCLHVMKSLLAELDILCTVAGYPVLRDVRRDALRHVSHSSVASVKL